MSTRPEGFLDLDKILLQLHLKQKSYYCMNLGKAYTFLFGQSTTGPQHRIEVKAK